MVAEALMLGVAVPPMAGAVDDGLAGPGDGVGGGGGLGDGEGSGG